MSGVHLVRIWYIIMTGSGVSWIMLHRELSTRVPKARWCPGAPSWLLRALRDVPDESLLAKYLLLLLLLQPTGGRETGWSDSICRRERFVCLFV